MKKIVNISSVTDYSGESPIVTYSNPVETVLRQTPVTPKIIRIFYCLPCDCCCNCNCCDCDNC